MWPDQTSYTTGPEEEREEERRTITELHNIDWRETSFVPAGDNPPARMVMWKQDPGLTEEEIEEILSGVEGEIGGGSYSVTKFEDVNTKAAKLILEEPGRFEHIASPSDRLAAARSVVNQREFAKANQAPLGTAQGQGNGGATVQVSKAQEILAEHQRKAESLLEDPRVLMVPEPQRMVKARMLAWEEGDLGERYQKALNS